ncbi:hypothetical protein LIER_30763 [Lithospermum erythrorhizon]|uniref:Uncharacterized protein n=1 Tax=Lithospermum erythrorhizon TaxID=34254 RepID=A0AAV3RPT6_LITER
MSFTAYWVNTRPLPLHFYSDPRVLRMAGLIPGSTADPGTPEALRATFNVLELDNHFEVGSLVSLTANPSSSPAVPNSHSPPSLVELSVSRKRMGSPPMSPQSTHPRRMPEKAFMTQVGISFAIIFTVMCPLLLLRFFAGPLSLSSSPPKVASIREISEGHGPRGINLFRLFPKERGIFFLEAQGSGRRGPPASLKTLTPDYDSLKERYAANVRKTDSLLEELEGVRVERNSTQHERDCFRI